MSIMAIHFLMIIQDIIKTVYIIKIMDIKILTNPIIIMKILLIIIFQAIKINMTIQKRKILQIIK